MYIIAVRQADHMLFQGISAEASGSGSAAAPPVKPKRKPPRKLGVPDGVEMVRNEIGHWVLRAKAYPPAEGSAGDDGMMNDNVGSPSVMVLTLLEQLQDLR
jgi:hypothetical protein